MSLVNAFANTRRSSQVRKLSITIFSILETISLDTFLPFLYTILSMNPEQILIVFMILLLGIVVVHVLSNILGNLKDLETQLKPPHTKHDWYTLIDETGKDLGMICMECKKTPVDIQREFEQ